MSNKTSLLFQILVALLPNPVKVWLLRTVLGWQIGRRVRLGFSLLLCDTVILGDNVRIGHFNVFKGLRKLEIAASTIILNFNDFSGNRRAGWPSTVRVGQRTVITSHHYFDCGGTLVIGEDCTIGGRDTHVWTHSLRHLKDGSRRLEWREAYIGHRCYLGARVIVVHTRIPDESVVGAGSVVVKDYSGEPGPVLLAGNPAEIKRHLQAA